MSSLYQDQEDNQLGQNKKLSSKHPAKQNNDDGIFLKPLYFLAFGALIAVLILSPLPFGSNRPWSWSLIAVFSGIGMFLWSVSALGYPKYYHVSFRRVRVPIVLFSITIIWTFLQFAATGFLTGWHHPIWQLSNELLENPTGYSGITTSPYHSSVAIMRLASYLALFWLAMEYGRKRDYAKIIIYSFMAASFFYAAYGLIIDLGGFKKILIYDKWAYLNSLTSSFVNRNSYASYASIGAICALVFLVKSLFSNCYNLEGKYLYRQIIVNLFSVKSLVYLIILGANIFALLLTHSRGGMIAFICGSTTALLLLALSKNLREYYKIFISIFIIVIIMLLAIFSTSRDSFVSAGRLTNIGDNQSRIELYKKTFESSSNTGMGFGTYEHSIRLYLDDSYQFPANAIIDHAHNTYLENIFELGWPAALCLFGAILWCVYFCAIGSMSRNRSEVYPIIAAAASASLGVHSIFDFSAEIPAIAASYAILLGVGYAQSWSMRNN